MDRIHNKRILLVDDEIDAMTGLKFLLESDGYQILCARDGMEAIKVLESEDVDLVLTDLKMPEVSGLDLLEKITHEKESLPVIIITAYGEVENYLQAMSIGAFEYLLKPIKYDLLSQKIESALTRA